MSHYFVLNCDKENALMLEVYIFGNKDYAIYFSVQIIIFNILYYFFAGCKIVDWQLCAGAHPLADIAASMLYNCDPQVIEDGFDQMLEAYYKVFQETCKSLKIEPPFSFQNLREDMEKKGFAFVFAVTLFFYDPICREEKMMKRVRYILEKSLKHTPELFQ